MTPKEKAEELKEKFDGYICYADVAVDEIVQSRKDDNIFRAQDLVYWQQVKQELEKL